MSNWMFVVEVSSDDPEMNEERANDIAERLAKYVRSTEMVSEGLRYNRDEEPRGSAHIHEPTIHYSCQVCIDRGEEAR